MSNDLKVEELHCLALAWGGELRLQQVVRAEGAGLLRLRIRQGRRFTDVELAAAMARELAAELLRWADAQPSDHQ